MAKQSKKIKGNVLEKKKCFVVSVDVFEVDISFFINYSTEEMLKESGKISTKLQKYLTEYIEKEEPDTDSILGRMYPLKSGYAVKLKFFKNSFRLNVALVAHEVSHLVSWILLDRCVPLSKDSDEVYAYLTEDIMKKFLFKWY